MAIFNEILNARYARFTQKLFSMKGSAPMRALGGELGMTMSFFNGVENRYLEGWDRFGFGQAFAAGGAGNFNHFQIRNPAGSNTIFVVEKIAAFSGAAADSILVSHGVASADLANVSSTNNTRLDPRGRPQATAIISNQQTAQNQLTSIMDFLNFAVNFYAQAIAFEDQEVPLLPGDAIRLVSGSANTAEDFVFQWRERSLEESERT